MPFLNLNDIPSSSTAAVNSLPKYGAKKMESVFAVLLAWGHCRIIFQSRLKQSLNCISMATPWYFINNLSEVDSPALVIYPDRVSENIKTLVSSIDDVNRLRPHIKTHKSAEVTKMMLAAGIHKFKCATIAEAEMLAAAGAPD